MQAIVDVATIPLAQCWVNGKDLTPIENSSHIVRLHKSML
ncbi:hypothetical protein FH063_003068 [Azospirillum argentinense]|uniref:Uncharacterized protein n=1 Tax=Azospirillum argentinense TaxID=2970906 RepID=A0A5B0KLQ3_9PROT|nr:hypothetical protein FH063_003068 [Azospirillum argentinense]